MPFASDKQRRFLYARKPAVAKRFAAHTGGTPSAPKPSAPGALTAARAIRRRTRR